MVIRRTSPPKFYIPPTKEDMRRVAEEVGLKTFSPSFMADMANLAAGGKTNPPSSYRNEVQKEILDRIQEHENGRYYLNGKEIKNKHGNTTYNLEDAVEGAMKKAMGYHQSINDFIEAIDFDKYPGTTPLEKAANVLKILSKKEGGAPSGDGQPMPIFMDNDCPEDTAKEMNDIMDEIDKLDIDDKILLDPDVNWEDENGLDKRKVAEDLMDPEIKMILDISRKLDTFSKMKVKKTKETKVDPAGDKRRFRQMKDLNEITKLSQSDLAMMTEDYGTFIYKAVTRQYLVREKISTMDKKQILFILVDCSGSMDGERHSKATGVVMNRLRAVLDDKAEVYVALFDDHMHTPLHAFDYDSAKEVMQKFRNENFSGGSTNIAASLKQAVEFIDKELQERNNELDRPEVVILTDDDSSSGQLKADGINKVHGFAMGCKNPKLMEFCRKTGGVAIENF